MQREYLKCTSKSGKTKSNRTALSSKYPVYSSKKSRFMKEQKASGLLSSLGIKTPLNKNPLLGKILL